jgi:hypothetical protein
VRENYYLKARRLLGEGRLTVRHVSAQGVDAFCRGDSGQVYRVTYRRGGWACDCEARGRCSHLQALMLIVLAPRGEG